MPVVFLQQPKDDGPIVLDMLPSIAQYLRDSIPKAAKCDGLRIDRGPHFKSNGRVNGGAGDGYLRFKLTDTGVSPRSIPGEEGGIFSGDTVFVNACGRCDLRGGNPEQMFRSLKKISELDPATRLYPGHDYGDVPVSTVQRERERNPYFAVLGSLPAFVAHRMRPRG